MIRTTQLRVLRTSIRSSPSVPAIRGSLYPITPRRHVQPWLDPHRAPRFFSTNSSPVLSQASPAKTQDDTTSDLTLASEAANPPATTRPPPLELPVREPDTSILPHLFKTGKAYLTFYKTGLKNIYLNQRLVWSLNDASGVPRSGADAARPPRVRAVGTTTRSTFLLRRRTAHDVRRLPVFALILLCAGELTPFLVLALPSIVPLTCRIPRQVTSLRRKTEARRAAAFARLEAAHGTVGQPPQKQKQQGPGGGHPPPGGTAAPSPADHGPLTRAEAVAHIARSLNLVSRLWDRLPAASSDGLVAAAARRRVLAHLAFLAEDDALLRQAGGAGALVDEEVRLACADRGIDVEGAAAAGQARAPSVAALRDELGFYLELTAPPRLVTGPKDGEKGGLEGGSHSVGGEEVEAERRARIAYSLLTRSFGRPCSEHWIMARRYYDFWEGRL